MTQDTEELFNGRLDEKVVARILDLIGAVPNRRDRPLPGDVEGRFDFWFDGGACIEMTGWNEYKFADGAVARVATCNPTLSVEIRFPDVGRVKVQQMDEWTKSSRW